MPSLLEPADREAILRRLRQLQPTTSARWGVLTAPKMTCHLADQLRISLGEMPIQRVDSFLSRTLVKWIVVRSPIQPPPGKIQTAPEMLATEPTTWHDDLAKLEQLIGRLASTPTAAVHPYFGPLSHDDWGRLAWKHIDHHLRQFGC